MPRRYYYCAVRLFRVNSCSTRRVQGAAVVLMCWVIPFVRCWRLVVGGVFVNCERTTYVLYIYVVIVLGIERASENVPCFRLLGRVADYTQYQQVHYSSSRRSTGTTVLSIPSTTEDHNVSLVEFMHSTLGKPTDTAYICYNCSSSSSSIHRLLRCCNFFYYTTVVLLVLLIPLLLLRRSKKQMPL